MDSVDKNFVEQMPGYTRGLSFAGQFAFVGLSQIRETSVFGGVPIAEKKDKLRCGIGVVDLVSGRTVAVFQFHEGVSEIFALDVLHGTRNPLIAGASIDQQEREVWIVPAEQSPRPTVQKRFPAFCVPKSMGSLDLHDATNVDQLVELGNLRQDQGNQSSALLCYQRALEPEGNCIPALQNLGYLLFNMGEAEKAEEVYLRLLNQCPTGMNRLLAASVLPVIYDSLPDMEYWRKRQLDILRDLQESGETIDATKTLVPTCFFAAYPGLNDREMMQLRGNAIYGTNFITDRRIPERTDSRLKVAVVSAYFRDHTIGLLNIGRLEKLDRTKIHLTVISAGDHRDSIADRYRATADQFVVLPRDIIDAIGVMSKLDIDLIMYADIGMDSLTQTLSYSRFAPIQLATWGHPDTTGSAEIDYYLSSEELEPTDGIDRYTEQVLKLKTLGLFYYKPEIPLSSRSRKAFDLPEESHFYGCPQTLFKFHPEFDAILAAILEADSEGELVLLEGRLPEWTQRLKKRFRRTLSEAGRRVRFLPPMPRDDFLQLVQCMDVLLDSIHFGGGNSSIEAIAVGTPLVTIEGRYLRSRITSALYREIGFTQLIATHTEGYISLALRVVRDKKLRSEMSMKLLVASEKWFSKNQGAREFEAVLLKLSDIAKSGTLASPAPNSVAMS